jgi:hypothetical protein
MTAYAVTGTQADQAHNNKVLVLKMTNLVKTKAKDGRCLRVPGRVECSPARWH